MNILLSIANLKLGSCFFHPQNASGKKLKIFFQVPQNYADINNILYCRFTTNSHFVRVSNKSDDIAPTQEFKKFNIPADNSNQMFSNSVKYFRVLVNLQELKMFNSPVLSTTFKTTLELSMDA